MPDRYYFAYGSNLLPLRLLRRVPSARPLGVSTLRGHRLCWHKNGQDGSGKCDVLYTGGRHDRVLGVVYRIDAGEQALLDRAEGLGRGYDLADGALTVHGARRPVFYYRAHPDYIDPRLRPYDWYRALVVAGASHWGFAPRYLRALQQTAVRQDRDRARHRQHTRLLPRRR